MPKEYIEREALLDKSYIITKSTVDNPYGGKSVVDVEDIEDAPTADVVEVVRCKDCVSRGVAIDCPMMMRSMVDGYDRYVDTTLDDDFCSQGERKDGA